MTGFSPTYLSTLRRPLRWLLRFRHRCGYGVHSPYAFAFITGVVYEDGEYYAYDALRRYFKENKISGLRLKDALLLFRLTNFAHPQRVLLRLDDEEKIWLPFIESAARHARFSESADGQAEPLDGYDLMILGESHADEAENCLRHLAPAGMMVVRNAVAHRTRRRLWQTLSRHPRATLTFDLYDYGIVIYRPDMQRAAYAVNYF